jgi:hypothetical protein
MRQVFKINHICGKIRRALKERGIKDSQITLRRVTAVSALFNGAEMWTKIDQNQIQIIHMKLLSVLQIIYSLINEKNVL